MNEKNIINFPSLNTFQKLSNFLYVIRFFQSLSTDQFVKISCIHYIRYTQYTIESCQFDEIRIDKDKEMVIDATIPCSSVVTERKFITREGDEYKIDSEELNCFLENIHTSLVAPSELQMQDFLGVTQSLQDLSNKKCLEILTYSFGNGTKFNFIVEDVVVGDAFVGWQGFINNTYTEQLIQTIGRLIVMDNEDTISPILFEEMRDSIRYHQRQLNGQ